MGRGRKSMELDRCLLRKTCYKSAKEESLGMSQEDEWDKRTNGKKSWRQPANRSLPGPGIRPLKWCVCYHHKTPQWQWVIHVFKLKKQSSSNMHKHFQVYLVSWWRLEGLHGKLESYFLHTGRSTNSIRALMPSSSHNYCIRTVIKFRVNTILRPP